MLFTVLPFGGSLAMLLIFGGSLLPTKLEDYQEDKAGVEAKMETVHDTSTASVGSDHKQEQERERQRRHHLSKQHKEWLRQRITRTDVRNFQKLPTTLNLASLVIMAFLLLGTLAGIAIIEVAAVYMTWCTSVWWFPLWWLVCKCISDYSPFHHAVNVEQADSITIALR